MEINFKKKFGQNFLSDGNLLSGIVEDSKVSKNDVVIEVGAGAGALTKRLAAACKKVVAFEIDTDLEEVLKNNLSGIDNIDLEFCDFMKLTTEQIEKIAGKNFAVVANLPYYITSPLISKFLNKNFNVKSITVMVQKEVGERIVASPKTKDYGVLSVMVQVCSKAKITRNVSRKMFTPEPNVDSCVVNLSQIDIPQNYDKIVAFVKQAFLARRKTLVNNLSKQFEKTEILKHFAQLGISQNARAEELSPSQFINLFELFDKI